MIYRKHIQREYLAATRETMAERRVDIIVSSILGILGILAIFAFTLAVLSRIGAI